MQISQEPLVPDADESLDLAALFRLLGDPTRVRLLYALLAHDELSVGALADEIGTNDTKVSQALRLLRSAGIVRNRRDGRTIWYRLDDEHVRTLLEVCRDHLAHQDGAR
ncbi:MAG: helix-turn-helix transcriptional regulator [Ilumatobacter sp.]|nr:helix-turn-helix transcriptional regulator [Ilumatobacter sp.]